MKHIKAVLLFLGLAIALMATAQERGDQYSSRANRTLEQCFDTAGNFVCGGGGGVSFPLTTNTLATDPDIEMQFGATSSFITGSVAGEVAITSGADFSVFSANSILLEADSQNVSIFSAASIQMETDGDPIQITGAVLTLETFNQASLPTPGDGSILYCSDCNPDATCTGGGAGAFAFRIAGSWACELN